LLLSAVPAPHEPHIVFAPAIDGFAVGFFIAPCTAVSRSGTFFQNLDQLVIREQMVFPYRRLPQNPHFAELGKIPAGGRVMLSQSVCQLGG